MARASKKEFIVDTATQVFLECGFKGTSIDMVVAACNVSKPTIYNHFPDKAGLMAAVVAEWLNNHPVLAIEVSSEERFWRFLARHWWHPEVMAMYRVVIGEGRRFEESAKLFWREFDKKWRAQAVKAYEALEARSLDTDGVNMKINHHLWLSLKAL